MKRFVFRFDAVERVRKSELDSQVKELGLAVAHMEKKKAEMSQLEEHMTNELKRLSALPMEMQIQRNIRQISISFRETMRLKIAEKKDEVLKAQHEVIREQRKVVEKRKKKLAMEKLREKEEENYYEEVRKKEMAEMDEISASLWTYRKHSD